MYGVGTAAPATLVESDKAASGGRSPEREAAAERVREATVRHEAAQATVNDMYTARAALGAEVSEMHSYIAFLFIMKHFW